MNTNILFSGKTLFVKIALLTALVLGGGNFAWGYDPLTINDGTATNKIPFDVGLNSTLGTKGQFIIPSTSLTALNGKKITKITFYGTSSYDRSFGNFSIYLAETENERFTSTTYSSGSMTSYYSGALTFSSSTKTMEIEMNYTYNGGNLLLSFNQTSAGTYAYHNWHGVTQTGDNYTALYTSDAKGAITGVKYLPKMTFTYEDAGGDDPVSVSAPTGLIASGTTPISTDLTWTNGGDETTWQLSYSMESGDHSTTTSDFTTKPYTLSGLTYNTKYYVSIRAKKGSTYSDWSDEINFTTDNAVAVTSVTVDPTEWEMVTGDTKSLMATVSPDNATIKDVTWVSSNTSVATVSESGVVTAVAPGEATITVTSTFDGTKTAACDITVAAPVTPTAFKAKELSSNFASLTWTNGGDETTWQIIYGTNSGNLILSGNSSSDITSKPYKIYRLNSNTTYYAIIRSKLGTAYSEWSEPFSFKTPVVGPAPKGGTETTEDFESGWNNLAMIGYLNDVKEGWGYVTGCGRYYIKDTYAASGKGLYVNQANTSSVQYIVTPWVEAGSTITFWACSASSSNDGFVKLYPAFKSGDVYYVNTSGTPYANLQLEKGSDPVSSTTSSTITDGGYVAIQLNYAAIDNIVYNYAPIVTVTTDNLGYTTFANSNKLDMTGTNLPSGLEAYKAKVEGSIVKFTLLDQNVPENTGVLLKGAANTEYRIAVASTSTSVEDNEFLVNSTGETFSGTEGYTYFGMKKNSNSLTFATFDPSSVAIPSNKAYLKVSTSSLTGEARQLSCVFDDDTTTGIDATLNDKGKMINDKFIYNLNGQRVSKPSKGLYIVDGKKVIVK